MGHIWLVPTPILERIHTIKLRIRHPILYVGCTIYSFSPKLWWQSIRLQHTSRHLLETSILPLSHTILMRCVRNRVLHLDACIFTIINELRLDIFTIIIRSKDLEFPPRLVLNQGLETFKWSKTLDLSLRK